MIDTRPRKHRKWLRLTAGGLFVAAVVFAYVQYRDLLSLTSLATHEDSLRHHLVSTPAIVYLLAATLYVAITGLRAYPRTPAALSAIFAKAN